MKKALFVAVLVSLVSAMSACTNSDDAYKALVSSGYTNIHTDGYGWFACSKDDFYHTKFTATAPNGKTVSGVVC